MLKKRVSFFFILFISSVIFVNAQTTAMGNPGGEGGQGAADFDTDTFVDTVNSGGNHPLATTNAPVTLNPSSGSVSIPSGASVSVSNGVLSSSVVDSLESSSGVKVKDGLDVSVAGNGDVVLASARSVKVGNLVVNNPVNFKSNANGVSFDSAGGLIVGLIVLFDLKESSVLLSNGLVSQMIVKSDARQSFESVIPEGVVDVLGVKGGELVIGLSENDSIVYEVANSNLVIKNKAQKPLISASPSKPNVKEIIKITKSEDGFITRSENSIITVSSDLFDERFVGNETVFEWNAGDGVTSAVLQSPGAYRFLYKELQVDRNGIYAKADRTFAQSFEIARAENLGKYVLSIDKPSKRAVDSNAGAFVSLQSHLLKLRGAVTYSRVNFEYKTVQRFMGGSWWVEVLPADGSFLPVVEVFNEGTVADISLDSNNIHANVSMTPVFVNGRAYSVFFDDLVVSESVHGFARSWASAPFIVDKFQSVSNQNVFFRNVFDKDLVVTQFVGGLPRVSFYSKQDARLKIFDRGFKNYFDVVCDDLNSKLGIELNTVKYVRGLFG